MVVYDFEFDGKTLSSFNMVMCSFGEKGLETISNGSQTTFNTVSTLGGQKHHLMSSTYDTCLEATFQICKKSCSGKDMEISSVEFRQLTKWLSRKHFLKFKLLSEEYIDIYYEIKFDISRIEINGKLYGLELTAQTNRPFALKEPVIKIIQTTIFVWERFKVVNGKKDEYTKINVKSRNRKRYPDNGVAEDGYYYVYIEEKKEFDNKHFIDDISHEEGYIYPHTEIVVNQNGDLTIHNAIENRDTIIKNCVAGEVITMDYPVITSSISSHRIQNDFNWNFFRIANTFDNSRNDINVSIPCSIKIKYSPVVKVGL